ncbi:MAG: hypothetical protein ACLR17_08785 [Enterobacteriaceae bacterium]
MIWPAVLDSEKMNVIAIAISAEGARRMCPKSQMNCGKKGRCENGDRLLMSMLFCPTAIDNDCVQIAFHFISGNPMNIFLQTGARTQMVLLATLRFSKRWIPYRKRGGTLVVESGKYYLGGLRMVKHLPVVVTRCRTHRQR